MKKVILAALIALTVSIGASAQNKNVVDPKAVENFEDAFAGASNVAWTANENFTKASFVADEQKVDAFYNADGDFIGTASPLTFEKLPVSVRRNFEKKYSDYKVKEAFKFDGENGSNYFISAENEKENVVLQVEEGSISVYSRTSKM